MAVRFDAETDAYNSTTGLPAGDIFSVTWWAYISTDRNANSGMWGLDTAGGAQVLATTQTDGTTVGIWDNNTYGSTPFGTFALTVGTWYKFALVVNGANATFYRAAEGSPLTSESVSDYLPPNPATNFWIGRDRYTSEWWDGRIAHFKMYEAELTQGEIEAELASYYPQRTTNLLRWHPFTEASVTDFSGNGNNLTAGATSTTTELSPDTSPTFIRNRSATTSPASNSTTHSVTLPTGVQLGDLLVCVFSCDGTPTISTSSTGWTKLSQATFSLTAGAIFYKVATGSDSLTVNTSSSEESSSVVYAIASPVGLPSGTSATGLSSTPNPPSHTPAEGNRSYIWIATASLDNIASITNYNPSSYYDLRQAGASSSSGAATAGANSYLTASSSDPPAFTASLSSVWVCYTLSIPAAFTSAPKVTFTGGGNGTGTSFSNSAIHMTNNDRIIMYAHTTTARTISTPSGWDLLLDGLGTNGRDYVFTRVFQTGDSAATFNLDSSGQYSYTYTVLRGTTVIPPPLLNAAVQTEGASGNLVAPSIDTLTAQSMRLDFCLSDEATSGASTLDIGFPSGMLPSGVASGGLNSPSGSTGYIVRAFSEEIATVSATGTLTAAPTDTGNPWTVVTLSVGETGFPVVAWLKG